MGFGSVYHLDGTKHAAWMFEILLVSIVVVVVVDCGFETDQNDPDANEKDESYQYPRYPVSISSHSFPRPFLPVPYRKE